MTQSPDNMGGQPEARQPADPVPGDQDISPLTVPPPSTWHFEPEPAPAAPTDPTVPADPSESTVTAGSAAFAQPGAASAAPPNGAPAPYGTSPNYGTPSPFGMRSAGGTTRGYPTGYQPYQGQPGQGQPGQGQEPGLAEWWRRLLARLIDVVVVGIVLMPVTIPLLRGPFGKLEQVANRYPNLSSPGAQSALSRADGKFLGSLWILALIAAAVWFLYDMLQHAKWGQTVGKRVLSTRVVSAYDRSPISGAAAAKRAAVYALVPIIPAVGTLFSLINDLWLLWDRRRQCLHDKAGRTIVIRTNAPGGQPPASPW